MTGSFQNQKHPTFRLGCLGHSDASGSRRNFFAFGSEAGTRTQNQRITVLTPGLCHHPELSGAGRFEPAAWQALLPLGIVSTPSPHVSARRLARRWGRTFAEFTQFFIRRYRRKLPGMGFSMAIRAKEHALIQLGSQPGPRTRYSIARKAEILALRVEMMKGKGGFTS